MSPEQERKNEDNPAGYFIAEQLPSAPGRRRGALPMARRSEISATAVSFHYLVGGKKHPCTVADTKMGPPLGIGGPVRRVSIAGVVFTPARGVIHPSFPLRGRWERSAKNNKQAPSPSLCRSRQLVRRNAPTHRSNARPPPTWRTHQKASKCLRMCQLPLRDFVQSCSKTEQRFKSEPTSGF